MQGSTIDGKGRFNASEHFNFNFSVFYILGPVSMKKKKFCHACCIKDDYGQLGAVRVIGYIPSHIQGALLK